MYIVSVFIDLRSINGVKYYVVNVNNYHSLCCHFIMGSGGGNNNK